MPKAERPVPSFQSRVRALVYGVAFGDALGAPVEKLSAREIQERHGRVTSFDTEWHRAAEDTVARGGRVRGSGIVTDDTLMTLCLMEVYGEVGRHLDAWDMAGPMVRRIAWQPRWIPEMGRETVLIERLFYPEKWIFHRLQLAGCDPRQGGVGNMVNCGAAMYAAPIGVVNACDPRAAYDEAIAFASGHQQSYGLEAAGVMAACVAAAFAPDATIDGIVDTALGLAKDGTHDAIMDVVKVARRLRGTAFDHAGVVEDLQARLARYSPMGDDLRHGPEKAGRASAAYQPSRVMAIEELPLALAFATLRDGDFRVSVEDGVSSGRDTDSIGVMAGALLGALHGEAVVEPAVLAQLDEANRLDLMGVADAFAAVAAGIVQGQERAAELRHHQRRSLAGLLDAAPDTIAAE